MKRFSLLVALLLAFVSLALAETAGAQTRTITPKKTYTPYRPSRPTLSPWFGLYNTNRGPLPNYYNYVVPQQVVEQTLANQQTAIQQQGAEYRNLQTQVTNYEQIAKARPTGSSSGFLQYRDRFQNQGQYYQNR
jgi:hypothetical protein